MANPFERLRLKLMFGKKSIQAADEMWAAVEAGIAFEVPISFDTADPTMRAVYVLQALHKEVNVFMRQSQTLIISKHEKGAHGISSDVHEALKVGGQLANFKEFSSEMTKMMSQNERFLREQGLDPAQMEKNAKEAEMKKHAIEVGTAPEDTGPDSRLQQQRSKMRESLLVGTDGRALEVEDKGELIKPESAS